MKYLVLALVFLAGYLVANIVDPKAAADPQPVQPVKLPPKAMEMGIVNPAIDMDGYLKVAQEAAKHRQSRRISEADFIKMGAEEGTIILDARSKELYDLLHIKGAINMSFPDIAIASLAKTLPDKNARILIYCNNNFTTAAPASGAAPGQQQVAGQDITKVAKAAFPSKMVTASLNISTYIALYNYGYKNVYELAPLIDPSKSKLTFESTYHFSRMQ
jgi:rhodanese-related sulfurtransferase